MTLGLEIVVPAAGLMVVLPTLFVGRAQPAAVNLGLVRADAHAILAANSAAQDEEAPKRMATRFSALRKPCPCYGMIVISRPMPTRSVPAPP